MRINKLKWMQKIRAGKGTSTISNVPNVLENEDELHNENVENNDFAMNIENKLNDDVGIDEEIDMNPNVEPLPENLNVGTLTENPNVNLEICMETLNEESNFGNESSHLRTHPSILRRKPIHLIEVSENITKEMPDKMSKTNVRRKTRGIWDNYFENLNDTQRCQLFVTLMKLIKMRPTMKTLGLRTSNVVDQNTSIVENICKAYQTIGVNKYTKDSNAT